MSQAQDNPRFSSLRIDRLTDLAVYEKQVVVARAGLREDGAERVTELWAFELGAEQAPAVVRGGEHSSHSPRFGPDGALYFLSPRDTASDTENKSDQVWCQRPGEVAKVLTDEPCGVLEYRVGAGALVVLAPVVPGVALELQRGLLRERSKNGPTGLLYTDMNVRSWDHWIEEPAPHLIAYSEDGTRRRDLSPDCDREFRTEHGLSWDLSRCGSRVAAACLRPGPDRIEDSSILVIDLPSGEHRHIGRVERVSHEDILFSPNGLKIGAVAHKREHMRYGEQKLLAYSLDGVSQAIAADWDCVPSIAAWQGNDALLVTAPTRGQVPLFRVDLGTNEVLRVTAEADGGSCSNIHCVEEGVIGLRHTFQRPPEVFRSELKESSAPEYCTALSIGGSAEDMSVESLQCLGDDGTPIQYFLLSPTNRDAPTRGTIVWIHGGPVSAWSDGWHWRWNPVPFLEEGYNLVLANPRGSTGFGQEFIDGVAGNQWGAAAYTDLMRVTDEVCLRDDVDASKLVAMGGSFGGFMSNWVATQTDRFAAIITHASLYRLSAFHGTTDYPAYWAHDMGLYPSDSPEKFDRYSPHRCVDQWKTPVLITHGERDYRVPISEALMLFEDLRRRDVDAQLLVFPDENHWILRPRNSEQWYGECLRFLASRL